LNHEDVKESLQTLIDSFKPDIIFSSGISSHIHGEGEYINIQYAYELIKDLKFKSLLIFGGLQSTANPELILTKMPRVNYLISGESEIILKEIAKYYPNKNKIEKLKGINFLKENKLIKNSRQKIIDNMDDISPYDYSLFDNQVFIRPYNGKLLRAVDYELSRGCIVHAVIVLRL